MKEMKGISASPGIAIGKVFLYIEETPAVPQYDIEESHISAEYKRFLEALDRSILEIETLKQKSENGMRDSEMKFLDSHLLMLKDPDLKNKIDRHLNEKLKNVEWVLIQAIEEIIEKLNASQDAYLRERAVDIYDVSRRVLNHLMYRERISLSDLSEEVILISHNLLPSDTIGMNPHMVKGIAMDAGGKTSHTAIIARAFEIPAVLGLSDISESARDGDEIIIDGNAGKVILKPDKSAKGKYSRLLNEWRRREVQLMRFNDLPAETKDGKLVSLKGNIELAEEIDAMYTHGAEGIGLYRSEFLFLKPRGLPNEEEQYNAYRRVLEAMGEKSVTIRTLDVGGDKIIPELKAVEENNPLLGWRAIRFCIARQELFRPQLRALLRASVHGKLRIMFPMISSVEELKAVYSILDEVKEELTEKGIEFEDDIPVGIMIEVPSAALTSDILATKVNFFSIGTNDLIQYTIAVDRGNEHVAYLYEPFHPSILRLIKMVIENGHKQGIPVGMCGEMAGDPLATVVLLGLGLDEYSMSAFSIPEVKRIIRSVSVAEAEELVGTLLRMKTSNEIDRYVKKWMKNKLDVLAYS